MAANNPYLLSNNYSTMPPTATAVTTPTAAAQSQLPGAQNAGQVAQQQTQMPALPTQTSTLNTALPEKDEKSSLEEKKKTLLEKIQNDTQTLITCTKKFNDWDTQYKNHPDKIIYQNYVNKWELFKERLNKEIAKDKAEVETIQQKVATMVSSPMQSNSQNSGGGNTMQNSQQLAYQNMMNQMMLP